jgi:chemotaxis signal transduction protein
MKKEVVEALVRQFNTFRIQGRLYGIDIQDVKEINTGVDFTPIFHAPNQVKGYINIRGQIYLLLDLRRILGFEDKAVDGANQVVLFKPDVGQRFGVLVDNIADIVAVDIKQIENRRKNSQELPDGDERRGADIAEGICKMEDELLVIINSQNLLGVVGNLRMRSQE